MEFSEHLSEPSGILRKATFLTPTSSRFPTTPSRVQISLWPGGSSEYANGTIEWAGGEIDYDHEDYVDQGYYWCTLQTVSVWCANSPTLPEGDDLEAVTGWGYTGNNSQGIPVGHFS